MHIFKCVCGEIFYSEEIVKTVVPSPTGGIEVRAPDTNIVSKEKIDFYNAHNKTFGHSLEYQGAY